MTTAGKKKRAPRNRTLELSADDRERLSGTLLRPVPGSPISSPLDRVICGESVQCLHELPEAGYDLLFADPPYNLDKVFGSRSFRETGQVEYEASLREWLAPAARCLKPGASAYICGDWRSAAAIQRVGSEFFTLRNRITWEREKGRGSRKNWKSTSEDIWFFTVGDEYYFDPDAVLLKRRVLAPYKEEGEPKDWREERDGRYRLTYPSNLWTDLTVPFWSMPENTDHPTQKPEKLLAKLILASTAEGNTVLDPFLGSGTAAVAAKKLGRHFTGIEIEEEYCLLAARRLELAESDRRIQGLDDGIFWERNAKQ